MLGYGINVRKKRCRVTSRCDTSTILGSTNKRWVNFQPSNSRWDIAVPQVAAPDSAPIARLDILGGLLHDYYRRAA